MTLLRVRNSGLFGFGLLRVQVLLFSLLLGVLGQEDPPQQEGGFGEQCLSKFKRGRDDFILDADESVKAGATFIAKPGVVRYKDCVVACCKDPRCNVAFMEGDGSGPPGGEMMESAVVKSCFTFDCLYSGKYACRFVRKKGYISYILDSLYDSHLAEDEKRVPNENDHPPEANGGPDQVVQPQDSVTLNGIQSKDDHKIESFQWQQVSGNPFAVIETTNFDDQVIVSNLTSGVYKFKLTVTDSSGQSDSTQITVLVLTPAQSDDHCMAPKKIGPCRGSFPRWHYNAASERCEQFNFGGCRPNRNNYVTNQECVNVCSGSVSEKDGDKASRGLLPPKEEKCGATCTAEQFACANGCCLDKSLECDQVQQCSDGSDEAKCQDLNTNFRILLQIPVDEQKVRCTDPPHTGGCRDSVTKWYYNPLDLACFRFNYGGCNGNENRFEDEASCMKICRGVTQKDIFARKEEFERQESSSELGVIVAAAVLGLAILILLCVLAYCCLKGKKRQSGHQRVAMNGTQVTTMEDTERLVYNSTTKPI